MKYKKYKLGDICKIFGRIGFRGYTTEDLVLSPSDGAISLSPSNIVDGVMDLSKCTYISWAKYEESPEIKIAPNDIVIVKTGNSYGRTAIIRNVEHPMTLNPQFVVLKDIQINPVYLAYFIKTDEFQKQIYGIVGGSAIPTLSQENLANLIVRVPNENIQNTIADILDSLDGKIELNKQINDNLEAMAKQLYDYWFVQFDFPNEEGKPYKSSGGTMVWNEKLKHEIPQKWSDCVLGDYIGRITNGLNPRKNFVLGSGNNYYVTIRSLVGTTIDWNNCDRCDDEALSKINSRSQLQIGDIIFSAIGTIGRTYYILEEPTNWNISETSFTLRAKENVPNDFFYGMLRSNEIQIKADKAAMGSTLRCLVMDSLCSLQYIEIPSYMMKLFAAKVSPLYRQIHRNNKEIAELTKQRDELLPLLMNGQASVNSD